MKRLFLGLLMLAGCTLMLPAVEIPISVTMEESQPYQRELRFNVVKELAEIENVKIVEPGTDEWFRVHVLAFQMKLEDQTEVGYAISYSIVEIPFYIHNFILENLDPEKRREEVDGLIRRSVYYLGADLMTVGTDGLQPAAERIRSSLERFLDKRIQTE
ncbi:MAG: hypothetical protein JXB06_06280 [Spirochaetales bacterium]|nr:hypothetical protein [Spirochaetales bacterium]